MSRACRYCGSPAKGNPCWYYTDHPELSQGGDPPCFGDEWAEEAMTRERRFGRNLFIVFAVAVAGLAALIVVQFH